MEFMQGHREIQWIFIQNVAILFTHGGIESILLFT